MCSGHIKSFLTSSIPIHNQNGDWAAHCNRLSSGANDGGYTLVCVNSASGENQCVGYSQAETAALSGVVIHENPATLAHAHYGFIPTLV